MGKLLEQATLNQSGQKFRIRLMSAGAGSSGYYPSEVIKRDGAVTFPKGTHIYFDHLGESELWERNGAHSIKDLVGVLDTDAEFDLNNDGLWADANIYEAHVPFIKEAMDDIALSIEVVNFVLEDGVIMEMGPHPLNAVSVVPRGGRDGKITALIESFKEKTHNSTEPGIINNDESDSRKDKGMEPEDIKKVVDGIVEGLTPTFDSLKEALTPATPAENTGETDKTPSVSAVTEALVEAGLPEAGRKRVYEGLEADASADVNKLIESEKAYIASITEGLTAKPEDVAGAGRIQESVAKTSTTDDLLIDGWK